MEQNDVCLIHELKKLRESSKEAVEGLESFSKFKQYLHVSRSIENDLLDLLNQVSDSAGSQLVLVCGGVGDGKSHLLSHLQLEHNALLEQFEIFNDATESYDPEKTSTDTLHDILQDFSDSKLNQGAPVKCIIAINLGTLSNFLDSVYGENYEKLKEFVERKKILDATVSEDNSFNNQQSFQFINFSDYHIFSLTPNGAKSLYMENILGKVVAPTKNNPFHSCYLASCSRCLVAKKCPVKENYEYLINVDIRNAIVSLLIKAVITLKLMISSRAFLNFIYDVIVGSSFDGVEQEDINEYIEKMEFDIFLTNLTPNLLFEHRELSNILSALTSMEIKNTRSEQIDHLLIQLNSADRMAEIFSKHVRIHIGGRFSCVMKTSETILEELKSVLLSASAKERREDQFNKIIINTFFRMLQLAPHPNVIDLKDNIYEQYIRCLFYWNKGEKTQLKNLYNDIKQAILLWDGSAGQDKINVLVTNKQFRYRFSQKLSVIPQLDNLPDNNNLSELNKFIPNLILDFKSNNDSSSVSIVVDFALYALLMMIHCGYRINTRDTNQFIKFVESIDCLRLLGKSESELFVTDTVDGNKQYSLKYDESFEQYSFKEI